MYSNCISEYLQPKFFLIRGFTLEELLFNAETK